MRQTPLVDNGAPAAEADGMSKKNRSYTSRGGGGADSTLRQESPRRSSFAPPAVVTAPYIATLCLDRLAGAYAGAHAAVGFPIGTWLLA